MKERINNLERRYNLNNEEFERTIEEKDYVIKMRSFVVMQLKRPWTRKIGSLSNLSRRIVLFCRAAEAGWSCSSSSTSNAELSHSYPRIIVKKQLILSTI